MFGDIDEVRTAENKLYQLKQTGSVMNYSTEFQRYGNQTRWDAKALMSHYERGLKESVRIELARKENPPTDILSLIEETVKIDNRMWEFKLSPRPGTKAPRKLPPQPGTKTPRLWRPNATRRHLQRQAKEVEVKRTADRG